MNIDDRLDEINDRMVAFMRTQLDSEGMKNYYTARVENNCMLNDDERAVIKYIWDGFPSRTRAAEIAAGLGQLGIALNLIGYDEIYTIENNEDRYNLGLDLRNDLEAFGAYPHTGMWQNLLGDYELYVTVNAVSGGCNIKFDRERFQALLDNGTDIIFCPELYGEQGPKEHGLECDTITNVTERIFHFHKQFRRE